MIRRQEREGWILIDQHDHAELAGDIMKHWGNGRFTKPRPYDEVLFAVREHDTGWKDWDRSPKVNPENRYPMNFMEMNFQDQYDIWTRCFKKYSTEHPYASALIALHFKRFNEKIIKKNTDNGRAEALRLLMNNFISNALDINVSNSDSNHLPEQVKVNLRFIQIGDIISLTLCHGWSEIEIDDVPVDYAGLQEGLTIKSEDGKNFIVSPYPFSEPSIAFSIRGRKVKQKEFSDDEELRQRLRESRFETLDFIIRSE